MLLSKWWWRFGEERESLRRCYSRKIGGRFEIRKVGRRFGWEWGEDREEIHQVESMKLGKIFLEVPAFWWMIRSK